MCLSELSHTHDRLAREIRTRVAALNSHFAVAINSHVDPAHVIAQSTHMPFLQMNFVKEGVLRCVSCLPYILPMMDSLAYGRFLFQKVPVLALIFMKPLQPFIDMATAFPMLSFVAFLGLFLFVVRNKKVPTRTIRHAYMFSSHVAAFAQQQEDRHAWLLLCMYVCMYVFCM